MPAYLFPITTGLLKNFNFLCGTIPLPMIHYLLLPVIIFHLKNVLDSCVNSFNCKKYDVGTYKLVRF